MRKTAFFAATLLSALTSSAQTDTARLIVHYKFSHIRDTTDRNKPYTENMVLFLGQNSSVYKSYDRKLERALMKKQMEEQAAQQKGSDHVRINVGSSMPTTSAELYQFPSQNKLADKESLFTTSYLIEQPMPAIKWAISGDTSTIGGLHCQKATGHFKGRDYTAWFAPDVPFHAGPWKLNGLPGLIVEAYDTNKEVVFKFDSMEEAVNQPKTEQPAANVAPGLKMFGFDDSNADPNLIAPPAKAIKTTQKEFDKVSEAAHKNPSAFMKAAAQASGAHFSAAPGVSADGAGPVKSINIVGGPPKAVINNPIELPEKP